MALSIELWNQINTGSGYTPEFLLSLKVLPSTSLPMSKFNKKLWHYIYVYIQTLEDWRELFPFENRNGERILNKIGWNPHSLRKVRLTHLYRYENYRIDNR